jgi:hypothetical protein
MRKALALSLLVVVATLIVPATVAADGHKDSDGQKAVSNALEEIKTFLKSNLSVLGAILLFTGVAVRFLTRKSSERQQWANRMIVGGAVCIMVAAGFSMIEAFIESFAPQQSAKDTGFAVIRGLLK